jgi:hypothetical protein
MDQKEEQLRVAVDSLIASVDQKHLRRVRKASFLCSAKCCDSAPGHEQLQGCVDKCQRAVAVAEETISNELQSFQRSLSLCHNACRESVSSELTPNTDRATMDRLQAKVDACTFRCVDDCLGYLPPLQQRLDSSLSKLA